MNYTDKLIEEFISDFDLSELQALVGKSFSHTILGNCKVTAVDEDIATIQLEDGKEKLIDLSTLFYNNAAIFDDEYINELIQNNWRTKTDKFAADVRAEQARLAAEKEASMSQEEKEAIAAEKGAEAAVKAFSQEDGKVRYAVYKKRAKQNYVSELEREGWIWAKAFCDKFDELTAAERETKLVDRAAARGETKIINGIETGKELASSATAEVEEWLKKHTKRIIFKIPSTEYIEDNPKIINRLRARLHSLQNSLEKAFPGITKDAEHFELAKRYAESNPAWYGKWGLVGEVTFDEPFVEMPEALKKIVNDSVAQSIAKGHDATAVKPEAKTISNVYLCFAILDLFDYDLNFYKTANETAELTEAAINWSEQEYKMQEWHAGRRGLNIRACSDEKLRINYEICTQRGYTHEADLLRAEGQIRRLAWAAPVRLAKPTPTPVPAVLQKIHLSEQDFHLADATNLLRQKNNVTDLKADLLGNGSEPFENKVRNIVIYLILAIVLEEADIANELVSMFNADSKQELKKIIAEVRQDIKTSNHLARLVQDAKNKTESLTEDVEKHDTLNPKLWNEDNTLKAEVHDKIVQIAEDFLKGLEEDEIKFNLKDIKIVGSNCSYNYNKDSDLDIHLVMETDSLECPDNLYPLLYSAYRSIYNNKLDIEFYGIPVEIYIETDDTEQLSTRPVTEARQQSALKSNGIYSVMNNEWIKEPVAAEIPDIDKEAFESELRVWEDKYEAIMSSSDATLIEELLNLSWMSKSSATDVKKAEQAIATYDEFYPEIVKNPELAKQYHLDAKEVEANYHTAKAFLAEDVETDINRAREIIADQLRGEWEADSNYAKAAADLAELDIDTTKAQETMLDIADEEHAHVGELEATYSAFDKELFNEIESGKAETNESLVESAETDEISKIEDFISQVYDLRKQALATEGEYSIGNLVFKELRNKGYLDKLRDLKNRLLSKELSLTEGLSRRLTNKEFHDFKQQLNGAVRDQVVLFENGVFELNLVKETDLQWKLSALNHLGFVKNLSHHASGKYDFSRMSTHQLPTRYFTITGEIKLPTD